MLVCLHFSEPPQLSLKEVHAHSFRGSEGSCYPPSPSWFIDEELTQGDGVIWPRSSQHVTWQVQTQDQGSDVPSWNLVSRLPLGLRSCSSAATLEGESVFRAAFQSQEARSTCVTSVCSRGPGQMLA